MLAPVFILCMVEAILMGFWILACEESCWETWESREMEEVSARCDMGDCI